MDIRIFRLALFIWFRKIPRNDGDFVKTIMNFQVAKRRFY